MIVLDSHETSTPTNANIINRQYLNFIMRTCTCQLMAKFLPRVDRNSTGLGKFLILLTIYVVQAPEF